MPNPASEINGWPSNCNQCTTGKALGVMGSEQFSTRCGATDNFVKGFESALSSLGTLVGATSDASSHIKQKRDALHTGATA